MALGNITVEPLGRQHDRAAFHCGAEALDRYLKQQARQDADKRVAAPFVAVSPPNARVLGYYTLSASVLTLTDLPDGQAPKARTWKTAYVTKSSKDIEVVGATNLKLKDHVGHQVTLTGVRNGYSHLQARSIKHVATSCS